jgi:hypothetical protein
MAYIVHLEERSAGDWWISSMMVDGAIALATDAQLAQMAACVPTDPTPSLASSTTLSGLMLVGCAEVGRYSYGPNAADTVAWRADQGWQVVGQRFTWVRSAHLIVNPSNYWPDIIQADCRCPSEVGFRLEVDVFTGQVVRAFPGIGCVVC